MHIEDIKHDTIDMYIKYMSENVYCGERNQKQICFFNITYFA